MEVHFRSLSGTNSTERCKRKSPKNFRKEFIVPELKNQLFQARLTVRQLLKSLKGLTNFSTLMTTSLEKLMKMTAKF
jgi:hypothetical protein